MRHGECDIRLVVKFARRQGDGRPRNDFLDENHAASPAVVGLAADIKPQVHFFEVAVAGERDAEDTRVKKQEADHGDQVPAVPHIEFRSPRDMLGEGGWIDFVVEHRQMPPLCRQKFSFAVVVH